ncbi:hypothetical protein NMG60_11004898 [Bertholletia excelsa]
MTALNAERRPISPSSRPPSSSPAMASPFTILRASSSSELTPMAPALVTRAKSSSWTPPAAASTPSAERGRAFTIGGRGSGGEKGWPKAQVQRPAIVDYRPVERDGGDVRESDGGVPDRGLICPSMLHDLKRGEAIGGGDQAESGRLDQCRARERSLLALRQARLQRRLCHGTGARA